MRILEMVFFSLSVFVIITIRKFLHSTNNKVVKGMLFAEESLSFVKFSAFVLIAIVVFGLASAASTKTSFHLL